MISLSSFERGEAYWGIDMTARNPVVVKNGVLNELSGSDVLAIYNFGHSATALYSGGGLSINSGDNTKIDVAAMQVVFVDYTDPKNPVATNKSFGPFVGVTITGLASFPATYIGIDSTGTLQQQYQAFSPTQRRSIIPLGLAIHSNNVNINVTNNISVSNLAILNQFHDLVDAIGALNIAGNVYTANGSNLKINKSSGTIFKYGSNFTNDPTNPHEITLGSQTALTFRYRQANSTESADTTDINPGLWDNAGTLTSVGNNNFSIQRIFMFQSGLTRIQYGQATYNTLASALAAINTEAFVAEANIAANGLAMGVLVVKGNATNLSDTTTARFVMASKFGTSMAAGASALAFGDVVTALGYTPVNKAGDTMSGALSVLSPDGVSVSPGTATASVSAAGSSSNVVLNVSSKGTSSLNHKTGGGLQLEVADTASAVNYNSLTGGAAGASVKYSAKGSDTNINIDITPKGTGYIGLNADTRTTGFNQSLSKEVDATNGITTKTLTKQRTYLTGTAGASIAITFPAASAAIDGQIMTVVMTAGRAIATWSSSGASFSGAPGGTASNQPYTFQYNHATLTWYIC